MTDTLVKEGQAEIFQPFSVFYNPVQEFNRDLTIAVVSEFANDHFEHIKKKERKADKSSTEGSLESCSSDTADVYNCGQFYSNGLKILEGLAASGLRSIRFAKEIAGIRSICANDFDKNAVQYIVRNIEHNQVSHLVQANCDDACMIMHQNKKISERFDVIDLDPYGSPVQFLDSTVQSVRDGGLLCITCTDMGVLCGNPSEACYAKYGSVSLKSKFCHEMALRIVLQSIESHANRYGRYIKPLISLSADFYVRVYVKVFTGLNIVKQSVTKLSMVFHCGGCGAFSFQPLVHKIPKSNGNFKYSPANGPKVKERCDHCNSRHHIGGPIWSEPMYDMEFIKRVIKRVNNEPSKLKTSSRITGLLTVMTEELQDVPLYYIVNHIFSLVHLSVPKHIQVRSALLHAGYRVSLSHAAKNSIKTDAPMRVLCDILRCWAKKHPVNKKHLKPGTIVSNILSKEPELIANFDEHEDAHPESQGLLRWPTNPERDWGPKPRAKRGGVETLEERRLRGIQKAKDKKNKRKNETEAVDYKQYECKKFKLGSCSLGNRCRYTHKEETLSNMDSK